MMDQDEDNSPDDLETNEDGSVDVELPEDLSDVIEMPDGSAVVSMETKGPEESPDFYANMAEDMDSYDLDSLGMRYVNLLENNERSVSVQVLLRLFDAYGVDWRDIAEEDGTAQLSDLRAVIQDPLFSQTRPDLPQLRAALVHAPALVHSFMALYRSYAVVSDQLLSLTESGAPQVSSSPEAAVHDIFRRNRNHFREVEEAAESFWPQPIERDEIYVTLKRRLRDTLGNQLVSELLVKTVARRGYMLAVGKDVIKMI